MEIALVYKPGKHCPGDVETPAGVGEKVYFIRKSDLVAWPTPGPNNGNFTAEAKFILKEGKKWHSINLSTTL